jgi:hypothetical protein
MPERTKTRIVKGNDKLPSSTYILSMNSAHDCPSAKMGKCAMRSKAQGGNGKCYALGAEIQYPDCLPARQTDEKVWDASSSKDITDVLLLASKRARIHKMKEFRFSESGDFKAQKDVDKMASICKTLKEAGVACYGYTARDDLDYSELVKVATVQGSGFMITNNFEAYNPNEKDESDFDEVCVGDCNLCNFCMTLEDKHIGVPEH